MTLDTSRGAVHVSVAEQHTGVVIRVAGALDRAGQDLVRGVLNHVTERPVDMVWLDVRAVPSFDAAMLSLVTYGRRILSDAGIKMYVVAPPHVDAKLGDVREQIAAR